MSGALFDVETDLPVDISVVDVSVVVIGRNEGARLRRCLASVQAAHWNGLTHELIYVDSGSHDDSALQARAAGAMVLVLAPLSVVSMTWASLMVVTPA